MKRVILIKYGELSTKKGNRNFFINTLYNNVKNKLKKFDVVIRKDRARMYIEFMEKDLEAIKKIVDKIFGIHMYHIAYVVETSEESIKSTLLDVISTMSFKTLDRKSTRLNSSHMA